MPHGCLRRPRRYPALAHQRAERGTQSVNVEGPAPFIALRNPGQLQVAVQLANQVLRHVEEPRPSRQSERDRLPLPACFLLEPLQLLNEPATEVRCKVGPNRDRVSLAVLLICGVEGEERIRSVKGQLP